MISDLSSKISVCEMNVISYVFTCSNELVHISLDQVNNEN